MTKRRQISLLPHVHQTEDLKRFFNSTVDQLFEDGKTTPVSGYIGRKPSHYDPLKDFYKPEPTAERTRYQLEPMMISHDENKNVLSSLFYEDLIANLSQAGALVDDPNRLFGAGYYSWAPPIDIDRIMNFQQYYWSGSKTNSLVLTVPGVEVGARYYGDGFTVDFKLPVTLSSRTADEEQTVVLFNGVVQDPGTYRVASGVVTFDVAPSIDKLVVIFRYGNISDAANNTFRIPAHCSASLGTNTVYVFVNGRETLDFTIDGNSVVLSTVPPLGAHIMVTRIKDLRAKIEGKPQFNPTGLTRYPMTELMDGMKVKLVDPVNFLTGYDLKAYGHPWDEVGHSTYYVEGVDIAITLIPVAEGQFSGDGFDADDPRYVVMARTDKARSFWSRVNRWVHRDALFDPADAIPENQAKRPIIEFLPDLQQFDYGSYRVQNTSGKISKAPKFNGNEIAFEEINGLPEGEVEIDDGYRPQQGDVLFVNFNQFEHNGRLYRVDVADSDGIVPVSLIVLEPLDLLSPGAVTQIKHQEYWFDGRSWHTVATPADAPLFDLFDHDGISLADVGVYPETNFAGSPIFSFAEGSGRKDAIIKKKLRHDKYGQIVFENELETRDYSYRDGVIGGYKYYLRGGKFLNAWHKADENLVQAIDDNNVSEIPLNLQANPDYETPTFLSRNDFFEHFSSILERQDGFEGKSYARNNWYKTTKDVTKGLVIIQHEAPLLKLMTLMADKRLSMVDALHFVEREYTRLKAKFIKQVTDLANEQDISVLPYDTLAVMALKRVTAGKTTSFPFHDSVVGGDNFFIPLTPSLLGINPLVEPALINDDTFGADVTFIRGHDGSMTAAWGDLRDDALLALENRIYFNAKGVQEKMRWDDLVGGANREALYSVAEATTIMMPWFERWARENDAQFGNTTYDANDAFTWNYRSSTDRYGNDVVGHWRGIYRHFFDTDRPHLAPWEMLGFAEKPSWWETHYGAAPYTRSNFVLWDDIEYGVIREGERAGYDLRFARPDLQQILPVGLNGELLDPVSATIIPVAPPVQFAQEGWRFGDGSNVEAVWRMTSNFQFAQAMAKFLMRPAYFTEVFWDILNETVVHQDQKVQTPQYRRIQHADLYIHGEQNASEAVQSTLGVQNWLVDALRLNGTSSVSLGETVRGLKAQLGHKVAGFTTKDRMTVSAESFGLVPDEDITIALYRSPSLTEFFYSGMIIENTVGGWRIVGYNPDYPFFDIIEGEEHSKKLWIETGPQTTDRGIYEWRASVQYKTDMLVEHLGTVYRCIDPHTSGSRFEETFWKMSPQAPRLTAHRVFKNTKSSGKVSRIEYGSVLSTKQDVADVMFGYERWLRELGFVFPEADADSGSFHNAVFNFLKWSAVEWKPGAFISLSPAARKLTFKSETGIVAQIENSIIDRTGHYIKKGNFSVDRTEDLTEITAHTDDIYGARLARTEIEHALVFSNETVFGDVLFNPLFNIRQYRLKLAARVAGNWLGRYEAPGFVIDGDEIKPNFVKLGEDMREMFDIELADNTVLRDHARHVIGFETREYLDKLLLNETQQFEMYQGMIQQKGSAGAMSAILRSGEIAQSRNLSFLEEWAFRVGDFGAFNPRLRLELTVKQGDIHSERQLVHFNPEGRDDWLNVSEDRWVSDPANFRELLTIQTSEALPDAGYARTSEATYMVRDAEGFAKLVEDGAPLADGQTVWTTHTDTWDMSRICWPTANLLPITITSVLGQIESSIVDSGYRITFDKAHNLVVGDIFYLTAGDYEAYQGTYEVQRVGTDFVEIDDDLGLGIDFVELAESGILLERPQPFVSRSIKVPNIAGRTTLPPFPNGTMCYVDDVQFGKWGVYKKIGNSWVEMRRQPLKVENKSISSGLIYDLKSEITTTALEVEPAAAERLNVIDPLAGLIAGVVDKELDFKLEYDPADYAEWDNTQLGMTWWDLSTVRFINYYTDAVEDFQVDSARYSDELVYRNENWSKVTSTSSIDIYEWSRRLSIPADVEYVARQEFDASLNKSVTAYYYWLRNPSNTPLINRRKLSARSCADIIANPAKAGLIWYAAMSPDTLLIAGTHRLFDDDGRVLQIEYRVTDYEGEEHTEWTLMRPGDKVTPPTAPLWNKLLDSARGYDLNLRKLPSQIVHPSVRSGLGPSQSIFGDVPLKDARSSLVTMLNYILARTNHTSVGNLETKLNRGDNPPEYLYWSAYTDDLPLLPPKTEYTIVVTEEPEIAGALTGSNRVLFDNRAGSIPSWSVWRLAADGQPEIVKNFDYVIHSRSELRSLFLDMSFKERVLILNDEQADGFWTIWEKRGDGAWDVEPFDQFLYDGFTGATLGLVNAQKYRTSDFWELYDWYAEGENPDIAPGVSYLTVDRRNITEGQNPDNTFVKVMDDRGRWSWSRWNGSEWNVTARESATVQVKDAFFTRSKLYGIKDGEIFLNLEDITVREGTLDLTPLIEAIRIHLLSVEEENELWFSMIHFVHSKLEKVDWAMKTSFINVLGFNERLWASPVAVTENMPLLLDYIDEVKPYRAKVRDVLRTAAPDLDVADTIVTDFDKPAYYDQELEQYRVLDEAADADILSEGLYRHYIEIPDNRRKFIMSIKWDRIWPEDGEGTGAAERIMAFYQPGTNMREKNLTDLLNLDFKGTVYDGSVIGDTDYDIVLKGSNDEGSQVDLNVEGGFKLRDPASAKNKPEELVTVGTHDGLLFRAHDRWGNGAPQHTVRYYDVSRRTAATATLDVDAVCENIAVFRDGVRLPSSEFTFDALSHSVTVNINPVSGRAKNVAIHGLGFASLDRIRDQRYFSGGASSYALEDALGGYVEARVNGAILDNNDVVRLTNTVELPATMASDSVILTLYSTADPHPTQMIVTELAYNASKTWKLGTDVLPYHRPYHSGLVVEKNGLRLTPPRTYYPQNEDVFNIDATDASKVRVWDNRNQTSHAVIDMSIIAPGQLFEDDNAVRAAMGDTRFVLWERNIVFSDEDATTREYTVSVETGHDFTISEAGALKLNVALAPTDTITVTSFSNDNIMDMRTHVFSGSANGIYNLRTNRHGRTWMTLDGKRLIENIDYSITEMERGSWDIDAFERFNYDTFRFMQIALRFPGEKPPRDVVISTFEGKEANPARSWQLSTKAPEEMRLLPHAEDEALRYVVKKAWELSGLDYVRRSGALVTSIEPESESFSLKLNPTGAPTKMIPSQPLGVPNGTVPEVVWIDGERIEYFGYNRSGSTVTLSQLRRGTRGTAMTAHEAGVVALGIHTLDRIPPAPSNPTPFNRSNDTLDANTGEAKFSFSMTGEGVVANPAIGALDAKVGLTVLADGTVAVSSAGPMQTSISFGASASGVVANPASGKLLGVIRLGMTGSDEVS